LESEVRAPHTLSSAGLGPASVTQRAIDLDVTQLDQGLVRLRVQRRRRMLTWAAVGSFIWLGAWVLGRLVAQRDLLPEALSFTSSETTSPAATSSAPPAEAILPPVTQTTTATRTATAVAGSRAHDDSNRAIEQPSTPPPGPRAPMVDTPARSPSARRTSKPAPSRVIPVARSVANTRTLQSEAATTDATPIDTPAVVSDATSTTSAAAAERVNAPKTRPKVTLLPPPPRAPLLD
jgi:hypothetical protein